MSNERAWQTGDIVVDSGGGEWDLLYVGNAGEWCNFRKVDGTGRVYYDVIEFLLRRGWRLKEESDE